jgi:LPXTG-motif cell wall-anchored protein
LSSWLFFGLFVFALLFVLIFLLFWRRRKRKQ